MSSPGSGNDPVIVGIAGASGAVLAERVILRLGQAGVPAVVTCTPAAERIWQEELGDSFQSFAVECARQFAIEVLDNRDIGASIASGRARTRGMIVVPCSMDILSAVATGRSTNLLQRAADVTIKEGRRLVLVPRESPFSAIHLENMLKLARLGVRIVPPVPAFYLKPGSVAEIVDDVAGKAIQALGILDSKEKNA